MNRFTVAISAAAALLIGSVASAQSPLISPPSTIEVKPLPPGTGVRPFGFTRLQMKLALGQEFGKPHLGLFCVSRPASTWNGGTSVVNNTAYRDAFWEEARAAGFKVDGASENMFENTASTSDLQLGGMIHDLLIDYCAPYVANVKQVKGTATMAIDWQVYSTLQKAILGHVETKAEFSLPNSTNGGFDALLVGAFRENVRALLASEDFRKQLTGPPLVLGDIARPTNLEPVALNGSLAARPRSLSEVIGSVVMVSAGQLQGSGFLVSDDGLLLTDRHVVGDAKYVKVRWADGAEGLGEVLRSDKIRDVAIVKTDPRGRTALALRRDALQPGDTVYAVGAPLEAKFQSTMTRGVVSATRSFDGLTYIQSDVTVNPGNSGGPLVDEKGRVIGLAESSFRPGGVPSGINLFTPIGDALDFLGVVRK